MSDKQLLKQAIDFIKSLNGSRGMHGRHYKSKCGKFLHEYYNLTRKQNECLTK